MPITKLSTILSWFKTGDIPTEFQFKATWQSFWHKNEKIPAQQIENIDVLFSEKADNDTLENHIIDDTRHVTPELISKISSDFVSKKSGGTFAKEISVGGDTNDLGRIDLEPNGGFYVRNNSAVNPFFEARIDNKWIIRRVVDATNSYSNDISFIASFNDKPGYFDIPNGTANLSGNQYTAECSRQLKTIRTIGYPDFFGHFPGREINDNFATPKGMFEDLRIVDKLRHMNMPEEVNEGDTKTVGWNPETLELVYQKQSFSGYLPLSGGNIEGRINLNAGNISRGFIEPTGNQLFYTNGNRALTETVLENNLVARGMGVINALTNTPWATNEAYFYNRNSHFNSDNDLTGAPGFCQYEMQGKNSILTVGLRANLNPNYTKETNDNFAIRKGYTEDFRVKDKFRILDLQEEVNVGDTVAVGWNPVSKEFVAKKVPSTPVWKDFVTENISDRATTARARYKINKETIDIDIFDKEISNDNEVSEFVPRLIFDTNDVEKLVANFRDTISLIAENRSTTAVELNIINTGETAELSLSPMTDADIGMKLNIVRSIPKI